MFEGISPKSGVYPVIAGDIYLNGPNCAGVDAFGSENWPCSESEVRPLNERNP